MQIENGAYITHTELMEAVNQSSNGTVIAEARVPHHPIIFANPAFLRMTGYESDEILGRNCNFLQGEDKNQPAVKLLKQAINEQRGFSCVLRNYRRDGTLFFNELNVLPVFNNGTLTHFIGVQKDVTENMQLLRLREYLMAIFAHDLKNPVVGTSQLITLLIDHPEYVRSDEVLSAIRTANDDMMRTIQKMLDYFRAEEAIKCAFTEQVELSSLIGESCSELLTFAATNSVTFDTHLCGPCRIVGNAEIVRRILINLIQNAIKFSKPNSAVTISLSMVQKQAVMRVCNTGKSITQEVQQVLFERFQKASSGNHSGTGLGLYLTSKLAAATGATVELERSDQEQTVFKITFSAAPDVAL